MSDVRGTDAVRYELINRKGEAGLADDHVRRGAAPQRPRTACLPFGQAGKPFVPHVA